MTSIFGTDSSYLKPSDNTTLKVCQIRLNSILGKILENPNCKSFVDCIQECPEIMKKLNHPQTHGTFFIPYNIGNLSLSSSFEMKQFLDKHSSPVIFEPSFFYNKKALIYTNNNSFKIFIENTILNNKATIQAYHIVGSQSTASAIIYYIDETLY